MKENWFIMGDIHGDTKPVKRFYENHKEYLESEDTMNRLLLLGDVGANVLLKGPRDEYVKEELMKYPFTYICLRGNHESRVSRVMEMYPEKWEKHNKYGGIVYIEKQYPRIEYLEDGPAVYEFAGYRTLSIPGAYSVDKYYRLMYGYAWFEDEQLTKEEMDYARELAKREAPFDLVISHTCPFHVMPADLFLKGLDQSTVDQTMERFLSELEYNLEYKRWVWGHFHGDRLYPYQDGKQMLMLFNENVVGLHKFMKMSEWDSLKDILA